MARRTLYGGLWKTVLVILELINDMALRLNTEAADGGRDQVLRSEAASAGFLAELEDDHANSILFDTEAKADFASYKTVVDALKVEANGLLTYLTDGMLTISTLVISGVAPEKFKTTTTTIFTIAGLAYSKVAADNLVFSGTSTINTANAGTTNHWGVFLVQVDSSGTVTTKPGTYTSGSDQDYASEAEAIATLPAVDASRVQLGYITVQGKASTSWIEATSDMTPASDCETSTFYDLPAAKSLPSAVTDSAPDAMSEAPNSTLSNTVVGSGGRVGVGMAVDGAAPEDVQFDNAIYYKILDQTYFKDVDDVIDISVECEGTGDTITAAKHGAMWMFVAADGTVDGETDKAAQDYASAVLALAQYSIASNTLPVADHVPVGVIQILESAGGGFTWGDDSITAETETYYSFEGLPGIESAMTSFALDAAAATITYGAADIVLGTGVRVTLSGKANVAFTGTTEVVVGKTGAYLLYALANDTEVLVAVGSAYADLQTAEDAVRDLAPNPLMPLLGAIFVTARSNAFTPGTTNLDLNGIDTTFVTYGTGTNRQEHGRSSGSTFTPIDEVLHTAAPTGQARRP